MTIKQLIEVLGQLPDDMLVMVGSPYGDMSLDDGDIYISADEKHLSFDPEGWEHGLGYQHWQNWLKTGEVGHG